MTTAQERTRFALDDLARLTQHVLDGAPERRGAVVRARLAVQDECRELWGTRQLPRLASEMDLVAELGRLDAQVDRLARQLSGPVAARGLRPAS